MCPVRDQRTGFSASAVLAALFAVALLSGVSAAEKKETVNEAGLEIATFAGGCFWCVESDFDHVDGVVRTISGYTGGHLENPTYRQVTTDTTGHREAVQIYFDPERVSYAELLEIFWRSVDPTDAGGQFCDRGKSYTTAVFYNSEEQRRLAEASKAKLEREGTLKRPIATTIEDGGTFYPAEDYHQDYYKNNPLRYKLYRYSCGRDARIKELWGDQAMRGIAAH